MIGLNPWLITSELCPILEDNRWNDVNRIVTERKHEYSRGCPCNHSRKQPALVTTTFQISEVVAYEILDCNSTQCNKLNG